MSHSSQLAKYERGYKDFCSAVFYVPTSKACQHPPLGLLQPLPIPSQVWNDVAMAFGPYTIVAKIGAIAYKVLLPREAHIHPIFHKSQLKLFIGPSSGLCFPQVLIMWTGMDTSMTSWEDRAR